MPIWYTNVYMLISQYLYTFSKNDIFSSVWKRYCVLGLGLGLVEKTVLVKRFDQV